MNFSDSWARDTFWAIPGVLKLGDFEIARKSFEFFISHQRSDGLIPRKITFDYNGFKYLFKKSLKRRKSKTVYKGVIPLADCVDSNALFIIALQKYSKESRDIGFAKKNFESIKKAVDWYDLKTKHGLIKECFLANWMDTIFKNGHVLYSNVLYCQTLKSFFEICETLKRGDLAATYEKRHLETKDKINNLFWNGNFFDDELGKHKHFDAAGNVTACFFEIASPEKTEIIFNKLRNIKKEKLHPTVDPPYLFWKINPAAYAMGIKEYQNGISWSWIDILAAGAMEKRGFHEKALEHFEKICEIIVENGAIYETYWPDGRPFNKPFWKSAVPFAWSSGLFLEIYDLILKKQP